VASGFFQEPGNFTEWYFPEKLTLDVDGANLLSRNPTTNLLGLRTWHRGEINVPLYAEETRLTRGRVLRGARRLFHSSHIPRATYVDVRFVRRDEENALVKNGRLDAVDRSDSFGFGVRAIADGAWGFAASQIVTADEVDRVAAREHGAGNHHDIADLERADRRLGERRMQADLAPGAREARLIEHRDDRMRRIAIEPALDRPA